MTYDPMIRYSKTFIFEKVVHSVPFIQAIGEYTIRAWVDNTVRVSVYGGEVEKIERLAKDHGAQPLDDKSGKGEWTDSFR